MAKSGVITMSMRELDRLKAIQALVDGDLKPGRAAARLGLTVRQVVRDALRSVIPLWNPEAVRFLMWIFRAAVSPLSEKYCHDRPRLSFCATAND